MLPLSYILALQLKFSLTELWGCNTKCIALLWLSVRSRRGDAKDLVLDRYLTAELIQILFVT